MKLSYDVFINIKSDNISIIENSQKIEIKVDGKIVDGVVGYSYTRKVGELPILKLEFMAMPLKDNDYD